MLRSSDIIAHCLFALLSLLAPQTVEGGRGVPLWGGGEGAGIGEWEVGDGHGGIQGMRFRRGTRGTNRGWQPPL